MKIVFLDIDGVLNHEIWFKDWKEYKKLCGGEVDHEKRRWFDPRCIALINRLTDETSAKIVLSSTWRQGVHINDLKKLLKGIGITGELIGKTPKFYAPDGVGGSLPRGYEIKVWLEKTKKTIESYVILDDDSDMLLEQTNNFIKIDTYCGITYNTIAKAKQILI